MLSAAAEALSEPGPEEAPVQPLAQAEDKASDPPAQPQLGVSPEMARSWLALQCRMIPDVKKAALFIGAVRGLTATPTATWPEPLSQSGHLAAACRMAVQRVEAVVHDLSGSQSVVVASPLHGPGGMLGAVAVEVGPLERQRQHTVIQLLGWGGQWLDFALAGHRQTASASRLAQVMDVTAVCLEHERFQAAAVAAVNFLATALQCERVSLGFLRRGHMRVLALSHTARLDSRSNLLREIETAMDEALDENAPVVYPPLDPGAVAANRAHERLVRNHERGSVCTLPLCDHGKALGAITFERARGDPFEAETVAFCDAAAALLAPVLEMKRREDRTIGAKLLESASELLSRLFGPRHLRTKLVGLTLCGLSAFMGLANGEFRITASAVLEGSEHRALVSPVDGFIETARARAGDVVKQGQLLATLDTRALEIERRKLDGERSELGNELRRAIGKLDLARVQILEAQVARTGARLALVEQQLARTRIVAPFAGFVVSGDLSRSLGAPVERGEVLFEIAPLDGYRVALKVEESDLAHVTPGQEGWVALKTFSDEPFPFVVEQVVGMARVEDGRNVFRVDAELVETAPGLRPGMNGVAKVHVGKRKLLWVWSRELLDGARVWLWSHLP